jgi:hypothetical protein
MVADWMPGHPLVLACSRWRRRAGERSRSSPAVATVEPSVKPASRCAWASGASAGWAA